eukprot:CAMPEP_0114604998 /NCGR_PEP_ID=MMETSP0168-20121206/833_1 /TAXON_ID=95228 ORGANISM="Vannella sp., Strain DIVA3 517/6/12" /NCGR_SAMPLE_ID=MMETSP0168 /ASSEMBLY_ACC=CAM_ASM_000044 /LENGTH=297 /DNA_ID=CAMNT_0001815845 /DNA_START=206 /DNA_END=1097 /DNA_ORIENTATION=-
MTKDLQAQAEVLGTEGPLPETWDEDMLWDTIVTRGLEPLSPKFLEAKYTDKGIVGRFRALHSAIGCAPEQEEAEEQENIRDASSQLERQASSPLLDNIAKSVQRREGTPSSLGDQSSPWSAHRMSRDFPQAHSVHGVATRPDFGRGTPDGYRGSPLVPRNYMTPQLPSGCCSCSSKPHEHIPRVRKGKLKPQRLFWSPPVAKTTSRLLERDESANDSVSPDFSPLDLSEISPIPVNSGRPLRLSAVGTSAVTFHDRHRTLLTQWEVLPWKVQYLAIICLAVYEVAMRALRSLAKACD